MSTLMAEVPYVTFERARNRYWNREDQVIQSNKADGMMRKPQLRKLNENREITIIVYKSYANIQILHNIHVYAYKRGMAGTGSINILEVIFTNACMLGQGFRELNILI